jgi:hypothetical protein
MAGMAAQVRMMVSGHSSIAHPRAGDMSGGVRQVMHGHNAAADYRRWGTRGATGYQLFQAQMLIQRVHLFAPKA